MGHFWWRAKRVVPFSTTFTMDPERGRRRAAWGALFAILGRGPLMISPPPSPLMLFAVFPGLE